MQCVHMHFVPHATWPRLITQSTQKTRQFQCVRVRGSWGGRVEGVIVVGIPEQQRDTVTHATWPRLITQST